MFPLCACQWEKGKELSSVDCVFFFFLHGLVKNSVSLHLNEGAIINLLQPSVTTDWWEGKLKSTASGKHWVCASCVSKWNKWFVCVRHRVFVSACPRKIKTTPQNRLKKRAEAIRCLDNKTIIYQHPSDINTNINLYSLGEYLNWV